VTPVGGAQSSIRVTTGHPRVEELIAAQRYFSDRLMIAEDLLQLGARRDRR